MVRVVLIKQRVVDSVGDIMCPQLYCPDCTEGHQQRALVVLGGVLCVVCLWQLCYSHREAGPPGFLRRTSSWYTLLHTCPGLLLIFTRLSPLLAALCTAPVS